MPSHEHAADLERVLTRAANECESGDAWFGDGLPQALQSALAAAGRRVNGISPEVAFIDAAAMADVTPAHLGANRVVALSDEGIEALESLVDAASSSSVAVDRLICPFGVFDFTRQGLRIREIRRGLTAADVQAHLRSPLWSGPDLKPL